jgi:hypothetical protein
MKGAAQAVGLCRSGPQNRETRRPNRAERPNLNRQPLKEVVIGGLQLVGVEVVAPCNFGKLAAVLAICASKSARSGMDTANLPRSPP